MHCFKAYEIGYKTPYDIAHLTLGMLLHYRGKLKIQIAADIWSILKKVQAYCILIASNFVIRPQILIFLVLKNGVSFRILIANKIFHVTVLLVIFFCDQFVAPKIRHSTYVTAVFVNNQHGIQWRGQDFNQIVTNVLIGFAMDVAGGK